MFKYFIQTMIFWDRKDYLKDNPYHTKETCPFCYIEDNLEQKKYLITETKYWKILHNKFPYYWYKQNLLAVPIKHKATTLELTDEELVDYKNVEKYMKDYFWDKNYFSFIRQWIWWRSVEHLHYHYLEWIICNSENDNKQFNILNVS